MRGVDLVGSCAFAAAVSASVTRAQPSFQSVGDLPGGAFYSRALAISADGLVVAGWSSSANTPVEAFRWTGGAIEALGDLPGGQFNSFATGVSGDGSVVVGVGHVLAVPGGFSGSLGFRWENGAMQSLGVLPGRTASQAWSISEDGVWIAGLSTTGEPGSHTSMQACRWDAALQVSPLRDLPGGLDEAAAHGGVSVNGAVIVGSGKMRGSMPYHGCRWDNGVVSSLGVLPGGVPFSQAFGVSRDGAIVVGWSNSSKTPPVQNTGEACRWAGGGVSGLGDFAGGVFVSVASGVSEDGGIIVGTGRSAAGNEAFIWTAEHGMRRVQDALQCLGVSEVNGWKLEEADAITPDGQYIMGTGINPAGNTEGWIARIPDANAFCYGDCNCDSALTVADFGCFQTRFVAAGPYADCNGDAVFTIADFGCFQTKFVAGCP